MRPTKLLSLALGLCLCASQAFAGFTQVAGTGTNGALVNSSFNAGTSINLPITHALSARDIVVLIPHNGTTGTNTFSCSDAFGNTWQAAAGKGNQNGATVEIWYSVLTNPISNGNNLTCTTNQAGFIVTAIAFTPSGTGSFDTNATGQAATGTSMTVGPTPSLACPSGAANCDFCIGASTWHSAGTTASDATFTTFGGTGVGNGWTDAFKLVSANTALSYTATDTTSTNYGGSLACFKDTPVASKRLLLNSVP